MAGPQTREKLETRNQPNIGYDRAGPTRIERILQDNTIRSSPGGMDLDLLRNLQQAPGVIDRMIQDNTPPGGGVLRNRDPNLPPWYQDNVGGGEGSFWNVKADQPWQDSGVMLAMANSPAINKMKNIYNQVDPFFPNVNPGDQQIGYDFDKNLWGGTLGFGGGYDIDDEDYNAYINWGTNW